MTFLKQFSGRPFRLLLGSLVALDVLSFFTLHTQAETVLFVLATICAGFLFYKAPHWLLPISIAEIISTSNGHSLNIELFGVSVGIRMMLFGILMLATLWKLLSLRENPVPKNYRLSSLCIVLVLMFAVLIGWASGHSLRNIYLDANGYLAVGYVLAAWTWMRTSAQRKQLLQGVAAGIAWMTTKTLLFFTIFGHVPPELLDGLYTWIRDTRLGEVTLIQANVYRIFLQSQLYLLPAIFGGLCYITFAESKRGNGPRLWLMVLMAALFASLSRSFWLAMALVGIVFVIEALRRQKWKHVTGRALDTIVLSLSALMVLWVLIALPITNVPGAGIFGSVMRGRATATSDTAIDSRGLLLGPMLEKIREAPIAGSGLGTTVSYTTRDQRYIDNNGTDLVTTYAFEWGWLDFAIKFGVVGTLLFAWFGFQLLTDLWKAASREPAKAWLYLALGFGLLAIVVTHTFSPYLNHPLGWGFVAIAIGLLPRGKDREEQVSNVQPPLRIPRMQPTPAQRNT